MFHCITILFLAFPDKTQSHNRTSFLSQLLDVFLSKPSRNYDLTTIRLVVHMFITFR